MKGENEMKAKQSEIIKQMTLLAAGLAGLAWLFFDSPLMALLMAGIAVLGYRRISQYLQRRLLKHCEMEFLLFIRTLSSALGAGKSFVNAFHGAVTEMEKEMPDMYMLSDLRKVSIGFETNLSIEEGMDYLANKYKIETIRNFCYVVHSAIQKGGSLHKIIQETVLVIQEKNDVEKELEVIIVQKKYELTILLIFVPLIILYLRLVSISFSQIMYGTGEGRVIMTISLGIYVVSGILGNKIISIEV